MPHGWQFQKIWIVLYVSRNEKLRDIIDNALLM